MPRKECPDCHRMHGPRTLQCNGCGHIFETSRKIPPQTTQQQIGFKSSKRPAVGMTRILIPAGGCPIRLRSASPQHIHEWIDALVEFGKENATEYTINAFLYWVRDFYGYGTELHKHAVEVIKDYMKE